MFYALSHVHMPLEGGELVYAYAAIALDVRGLFGEIARPVFCNLM